MTLPSKGWALGDALFEQVVWHEAGPAPQGSHDPVVLRSGRVKLREASKRVAPWRAAVIAACLPTTKRPGWEPLAGALVMQLLFTVPRLARPKPVAKLYPASRSTKVGGDLSKLWRATEDALVLAGVMVDDSQVVGAAPSGVWYPRLGWGALPRPGCVVRLWDAPHPDTPLLLLP